MRFGIRPQAVVLAAVPLASLALLLTLASLLVKQTEQAGHLADVIAQSEQTLETVTQANRAVLRYARTKRLSDLQPYYGLHAGVALQEARLEAAVKDDRALAPPAAAFVRNLNLGVAILGAYVDGLRAGDTAALRRIEASPHTRQVSLDIERSQADLNRRVQLEALGSPNARRNSLLRLEHLTTICALGGIASTLLFTLLFGMRIVKRLRALGDNARRLADGVPAVPVGGNDEISELDGIYRAMADRIAQSSREHEDTLQRLERERNVTALLQQTLLPEVPAIGGVRIDTAYATAAEGAHVGGDWFDVFMLSERLVALSVGDVTGHGLRAAASMGFVRQAMRVLARIDSDPGKVLERVNDVVCEERSNIVSAFYGVYDREDGTLRYSLAGHGAPLLASSGHIAPLDGKGMILGFEPGACFDVHERRLTSCDALVLYTDGIIEVERDYLKGMGDLENAVRRELARPSHNVAEGIQRRIFEAVEPRDDCALLVFQVLELALSRDGARPAWDFDARNQRAAWRVKQELLKALAELGPCEPDPSVAEMVYGELISNVVRHTPGPARVSFGVEDGIVVLDVEDRGAPFSSKVSFNGYVKPPEATAESGRGLFIIRALGRGLAVEPTRGGKRTKVALPAANCDRPLVEALR